MKLSYDLHIHSCLSPCGDNDMIPSNIVGMAMLKQLDVIAVTDHCSCLNCPAVAKLAAAYGITALFGMELTTEEEVHVLCLFDELEKAMDFGSYVRTQYLDVMNVPEIFGEQLIMDEDDNIIGKEETLLINATQIGFEQVFGLTEKYGGVMIPAHVEKKANSLLANLGAVPEDSRFTCFEMKHIGYREQISEEHPYFKKCRMITNSDAHYLENINEPVNFLEADENTAAAVLRALKG
ncbi:MAG: PHP domain-containing protein [Oscillospiraceae bacterium]|nr:PHP domain-containing protein [Oscillospiraceae bacterium]